MITSFVCDICGVIDSTLETPQQGPIYHCTCCSGAPWHGHFPQKQYVSFAEDGPMLNRSSAGVTASFG